MIKKTINLFWFVLGFLICAHWDGGREFAQEISPGYTTPIKEKYEDLKGQVQKSLIKTLESSSSNTKDKIKETIKK